MLQFPSVPVVSRLAPTPSGFLHLGNAVNFTLTWLLTRRAGGTLHLRIDDLDRARFRPAYLDNIFRTLEWLGLDYNHGPSGPAEFERHYSQQHRLAEYEAALQAARNAHPALFFACRCSRTELARTAAPGGHYSGTCRALGLPFEALGLAWRARVPAATAISWPDLAQGPQLVALAEELGDFVVRKKDGVAAYQVASVLDDQRLGVNFIVRGQDLRASTAAQLWLAEVLPEQAGFAQTQFLHHNLLLDDTGQKLSKSTQTSQQRGILAEGAAPQVVYRTVATLLGLPAGAGESLATLRATLPEQNLL
ncbi:glutamate--tRNA ligase family protein [Hymenobacter terrestris]|uniref:Glutamyl/glutaminyl-tRNA synthetase class Ib catalytic domain-containing protein n=1 Tax=Hymenobacter terrestris TaxID=2748310 RepID=A0ABX2Q6X1_9BACT|nr:glutamate--tRNA ligase family protein [Hymenobacter terrestris]NVO86304.1 hypothetical protein [Hymenobacter terrestris]